MKSRVGTQSPFCPSTLLIVFRLVTLSLKTLSSRKIIRAHILECLLGFWHCTRQVTHIIYFDHHNCPETSVLLPVLFIRWCSTWYMWAKYCVHHQNASSESQSQGLNTVLSNSTPGNVNTLLYFLSSAWAAIPSVY